jgi:CRP-like cAMP-binding protein
MDVGSRDTVSAVGWRNSVLSSLDDDTRVRLGLELDQVTLQDGQILYEPGAEIDCVYFPESAVISIIQLMEEGTAAEIGMIGREGVGGLDGILRRGKATARSVCQVPGTALQTSAATLRRAIAERADLLQALLHYTGGYCAMLAQLIACNRLHRVEQRCARWLLMTVDRTKRPVFPMTQERLSVMLGAQRPTITATMTTLRDAGCLENSRGQVRIIDRRCLESYACECYALCASYFDL